MLAAGATRASVERVVLRTTAGGEEEATLRQAQEQGWKTFGHELEEPIASISVHGEGGALIGELTIPTLVGSKCDWLCTAGGPWAVEFDSIDPLRPSEVERHPDLAVISRDAKAREILEGRQLDVFGPKPWKNCAGLERGRAWEFMVERGPPIRRRKWPTLNSAGEKITVESTGPADVLVVDVDGDRAEVVSILPFDLNTWPLTVAGIDEAPFATRIDNEEPLKSKGCRILF